MHEPAESIWDDARMNTECAKVQAAIRARKPLPMERGCWDWLDSMVIAVKAECQQLALIAFAGLALFWVAGMAAGLVYGGLVVLGLAQ